MNERVVVTGIGVISPLGNSKEELWSNIVGGKCGIDEITKFDTKDFSVKLAAEVKDFDTTKYLDRKKARRMDLFCQYAIASSIDAWKDAGLDEQVSHNNPSVIIGSGIGGLSTIEEQAKRLHEKGPARVSPFFIPMSISNMASGYVAIELGLTGHSISLQTACASGSSAIGEAYKLIKNKESDLVVAGGVEAAITPLAVAGFSSMKALSESEDKNRASIPFDLERSGFVIGEGSATLILESYSSAKGRGAKIYGEVVGYGSTSDAHHITAPEPNGTYAAKAISKALEDANIKPEDVGYINAHGTSTPLNDKIETLAIKNAFGKISKEIPISSTKSMTGHLLGAAGSLEAAICLYALKEGILPPTINYLKPDPECDLDYIPNEAREANVKYALSNSFGFGGHNVTLLFKRVN
ncbi:MAG: beta-ketoacyl-ACP synthase II [Clostridia bacterium]